MAYLSSNILISSLSLLHLTVAYFLLTSPVTVTRHGMVLVLSSAFELVRPMKIFPSDPLSSQTLYRPRVTGPYNMFLSFLHSSSQSEAIPHLLPSNLQIPVI